MSNFVETEQIVFFGKIKSSFVQIRGSIPLFWEQVINIKYTPKLVVHHQNAKTQEAYKAHIDSLTDVYGSIVLINLVNKKGYELPLAETFNQVASVVNGEYKSPSVSYIHFDFHKECARMQYHRVSLLIDQLEADFRKHGYFLADDVKVESLQMGVMRTNCIDCLDRTNVVQSVFARKILALQLEKLGILARGERVQDQASLEVFFKNVWADNADACSIHYSGTGALKTDYTRYISTQMLDR